ncbi:MAG: hypothetical protein K0U74_12595 [Alphaproteobacteria bacterium]|nr:hypothetical protein [Alphaproteobacteria bacterium]
MATIIDFNEMREVLAPTRPRRQSALLPKGEVVLFTGVRYERYGPIPDSALLLRQSKTN